jgi:hypothetical protein
MYHALPGWDGAERRRDAQDSSYLELVIDAVLDAGTGHPESYEQWPARLVHECEQLHQVLSLAHRPGIYRDNDSSYRQARMIRSLAVLINLADDNVCG